MLNGMTAEAEKREDDSLPFFDLAPIFSLAGHEIWVFVSSITYKKKHRIHDKIKSTLLSSLWISPPLPCTIKINFHNTPNGMDSKDLHNSGNKAADFYPV
jgi:hypothetical protein